MVSLPRRSPTKAGQPTSKAWLTLPNPNLIPHPPSGLSPGPIQTNPDQTRPNQRKIAESPNALGPLLSQIFVAFVSYSGAKVIHRWRGEPHQLLAVSGE